MKNNNSFNKSEDTICSEEYEKIFNKSEKNFNKSEEYEEIIKSDNDDESEKDEFDEELYKLIYSKIKTNDNFDDYIIKQTKKTTPKNINDNNKKITPKNNDNKILFSKDELINKRTFKPRLPPYNKK